MCIGSAVSHLKWISFQRKNSAVTHKYLKKEHFLKHCFCASSPSPTVFRRSFIGLVDGDTEALVAPPSPDHVRPGPVEGHLGLHAALLGFRHGRLEALQRAGLDEAQGRAQRPTG